VSAYEDDLSTLKGVVETFLLLKNILDEQGWRVTGHIIGPCIGEGAREALDRITKALKDRPDDERPNGYYWVEFEGISPLIGAWKAASKRWFIWGLGPDMYEGIRDSDQLKVLSPRLEPPVQS
jgi:hypothetical protein